MPEKQYRNTITNLEPDVPRPEAASDNNVIHTPQAAELIERGLPELEAAELGLPELAPRPEPASPPVAAKGGVRVHAAPLPCHPAVTWVSEPAKGREHRD